MKSFQDKDLEIVPTGKLVGRSLGSLDHDELRSLSRYSGNNVSMLDAKGLRRVQAGPT